MRIGIVITCQDCGAIAPPLADRLEGQWDAVVHDGHVAGWTCPLHSRSRRRRAEKRSHRRDVMSSRMRSHVTLDVPGSHTRTTKSQEGSSHASGRVRAA